MRGSGRFTRTTRTRKKRRNRGLNPLHCGAVVASTARSGCRRPAACLNPLHCGAVVASSCRPWPPSGDSASQSPSLRGSGRFRRGRAPLRPRLRVSIPFIAGQWSLREGVSPLPGNALKSQSPSLRGSGRFSPHQNRLPHNRNCLNPLHCGAVVASGRWFSASGTSLQVSIPFIAGQWSLLTTMGLRVC